MLAGAVTGDATIVFQNLGIFVAGLVGCGQVLVLFVIVRAARTLPPLDSLHLHQWMLSTDYPDLYIQPAGILTFVFAVVLLFIEPLTGRSTASWARGPTRTSTGTRLYAAAGTSATSVA